MANESIHIVITENGGKAAQRTLLDIARAGRDVGSSIDVLNRQLNGIRGDSVSRLKTQVDQAATSTDKLSSSMNGLKNVLGAIAVTKLTFDFLRLIDTYQSMQNKIRAVVSSEEDLSRVQERLNTIANDTRTSVEGTVVMYTRLAAGTRELGVSEEQLFSFMTSLNQAISLSGASLVESHNAMIQLSQGMGSGALRGDELRSVLEQLGPVADVIARKFNTTRQGLYALGSEGKITTLSIIEAFNEASGELDSKFNKSVVTLSQALTLIKNKLLTITGDFSTVTGVGNALAQSLKFIANNLNTIIPLLTAIAGIYVFNSLYNQASQFLQIIISMVPHLNNLRNTLIALRVVQLAPPAWASVFNWHGPMSLPPGPTSAVPTALSRLATSGVGALTAAFSAAGPIIAGVAAGLGALLFVSTLYTDLTRQTSDVVDKDASATKKLQAEVKALTDAERQLNQELKTRIDVETKVKGPEVPKGIESARTRPVIPSQTDSYYEYLDARLPGATGAVTSYLTAIRYLNAELKNADAFSKEYAQNSLNKVRQELERIIPRTAQYETLQKALDDALSVSNAEEQAAALKNLLKVITEITDKVSEGRGQLKSIGIEPSQVSQQIDELQKLDSALVVVNQLWKQGKLTEVEYMDAVTSLREKMDSINPGATAAAQRLDELKAQTDLMKKWGGDMELVNLELQRSKLLIEVTNNDFDQLLTRIKNEKEEHAKITKSLQDQEAVKRNILELQTRINQLTMTEAEKELDNFNRLNPTSSQQSQFSALQKQLSSDTNQNLIKEASRALLQQIQEFNQAAEALRNSVRDAPQKVKDDVEKKIQAASLDLRNQAEELARQVAGQIGPAGKPLIDEAGRMFIESGGKIGAALGAHMKASFDAAVRGFTGAVGSINGTVNLAGPGQGGAASAGPSPFATSQAFDTAPVQRFNSEAQRSINGLRELNNQVEQFGVNSLNSFNGAGSAAHNASNTINNFFSSAFSNMENALVQFVQTGKFDFKQLITSIIADLMRMVIQMMIIRPLMGWFGGLFGFSGGGLVGGLGGGFGHSPLGFASGGYVSGPGGPRDDAILAALSNGEFVMNAASTRRFLPLLEHLNDNPTIPSSNVPHFASGGIAGHLGTNVNLSGIGPTLGEYLAGTADYKGDSRSASGSNSQASGDFVYSPNIVVNVSTSGKSDGKEIGRETAQAIDNLVRTQFAELARKETRPGGMLARQKTGET